MSDPLADTVVYEAELPVSWEATSSFQNSDLAAAVESNERLLHTLLLMDEHHIDASEEQREWTADIARLETKLDLLIAMLSRLVPVAAEMQPVRLKLSAGGLQWKPQPDEPLQPGDKLWLSIGIDPRLPDTLKLAAEVLCSDLEHGCTVNFVYAGEAVTELLEKVIFKHHRRAIAQLRAQHKPE